ncbi:hypothetical protein [Bacillus sp. Hm123]|uniref:hypothetical protein n=1 Tax=Bacillus sp. Hm123 TaxID=3450745 RepID=UPI003F43A95E
MNFVLSASRLMKVSEVREISKELRENAHVLLNQDFEAQKRYFALKEKAAS